MFKLSSIFEIIKSDIFKTEYLKLLEVGMLIGYLLGIMFLFLMQFIQLERAARTQKKSIYLLMVSYIFVTIVFISAAMISINAVTLSICFLIYLGYSLFMEKEREHFLYKDDFKHAHEKHIF